jgi:hypothetical protein
MRLALFALLLGACAERALPNDDEVVLGPVDAGVDLMLSAPDLPPTDRPPAGLPTLVPAGGWVADLLAADVDADGHLDLVVATATLNNVAVFLGDGHGGFTLAQTLPEAHSPTAVALSDFNEDGRLDLIVATTDELVIYPGQANGPFGASHFSGNSGGSHSVVAGDFDGDGHMDVIANGADFGGGSGKPALWRGDGTGVLQQQQPGPDYLDLLTAGDFDEDGRPDVAGMQINGEWEAFRVAGTNLALMASGTVMQSITRLRAAEVDGDGHLDLVATLDQTNSVNVLQGHGDGTFATPLVLDGGNQPSDVAIADLNGDGYVDLIETDSRGYAARFHAGAGHGTFLPGVGLMAGLFGAPQRIATGDFDEDGRPDVAVGVAAHVTNSVYVYFTR